MVMADLFISCWHFFSKYTDIWERFSFIENYRLIILFAVFTLALFAGFFVFRIYFSITFFYAYVTGCVLLM